MARSTTFGASVTTGLPDTWDTLCLPGITYQSYTLLHGHPQLFGSWGEEGKDRLLRTRPSTTPTSTPTSTQGSLAPILPTLD